MRMAAVGLVAAGVLTLGVATEATAAPAAAAAVGGCKHAAVREKGLEKLEARIDGRVAHLQAAEEKAASSGHARRAGRIAKRLEKLKDRMARVQGRLAKLEARCGGAPPVAGS